MNKYLIKYTKTDYMKYISHLDLISTFQRAFRRAEISVAYSQGFSPHPKLSIAHPLSVGLSSISEYMEVYIENNVSDEKIISRLNAVLPSGISILQCHKILEEKKSLAALVAYGNYEISFISNIIQEQQLIYHIKDYLSKDEIIVTKKRVKNNSFKEINIRPFIHDFKLICSNDEAYKIQATINTGSNGNLNPELMMQSFIKESKLKIELDSINIIRKELYFMKDHKQVPLNELI